MKSKKTVIALLFLSAGITGSAYAQISQAAAAKYWQDEKAVQSFLGSYGFIDGAEPELTQKDATLLRGLLDVIRQSPRTAITQLEQNITSDSSAALDFILGNLYFQTGNTKRAAEIYERALRKFPNFRRAYKNLGLIRIQEGDYKGAIANFTKAIELGETDSRTYGLVGYSHLNLQNYLSADIAYRQALMMDPENRDWRVGLVRALTESHRSQEAGALLEELIQEDPTNVDYWLYLVNVQIAQEKVEDAATTLEVVRRMDVEIPAESLSMLGDIYLNLQQPALALEAYTAALSSNKRLAIDTPLRAADIMSRLGDHASATDMIAKIRDRYDNLTHDQELKLLNLEARIARAEGDAEKAHQILTAIVERDGTNGEALIEIARYYEDEGEKERAIVYLERAQNLEQYRAEALLQHGQLLVRDGKYEEAIPLLRTALQLKPNGNVAEYLRRVEQAAAGRK